MFKKIKSLLLVTLVVGSTVVGCSKTTVEDDKIKVTLVLDEGGVNDQSFNQSAWEGALKAKENLDIDVSYLESKQVSDYTTNIENAIDKDSDANNCCHNLNGFGFCLYRECTDEFYIIDGQKNNQ